MENILDNIHIECDNFFYFAIQPLFVLQFADTVHQKKNFQL